jgi:hypothetical protein
MVPRPGPAAGETRRASGDLCEGSRLFEHRGFFPSLFLTSPALEFIGRVSARAPVFSAARHGLPPPPPRSTLDTVADGFVEARRRGGRHAANSGRNAVFPRPSADHPRYHSTGGVPLGGLPSARQRARSGRPPRVTEGGLRRFRPRLAAPGSPLRARASAALSAAPWVRLCVLIGYALPSRPPRETGEVRPAPGPHCR